MKTTVPVRKRTVQFVPVLAIATYILAVSFTPATGKPVKNATDVPGTRVFPHDTILVQKQITSKKYKIRNSHFRAFFKCILKVTWAKYC